MKRLRPVVVLVWLGVSSVPWLLAAIPALGATADAAERSVAIDRLCSEAFVAEEPGAAVLVIRQGNVVLRRGYGLADLELGVPVDPDMVFRIGSITKTFTAVAILKLVQDGALELDGDLRERRPHLPHPPDRGRPITIRQLLSHTAGLADLFDESYYQLLENRAHALMNDEVEASELVALIEKQEPAFEPGEDWQYSNAGYFLLGQVIESVTGTSYAEAIDRIIVRPLGLAHTGMYQNLALTPGRVKSYLQNDDGTFIRNPYSSLSAVTVYSAGGLVSTVDDLARLSASLDAGRPLRPEVRELMFTPATEALGGSTRYAFGWFTTRLQGRAAVHHEGDIYGYSGTVWRVPEEDLFVAILSANPALTSKDLAVLAKRALAVAWGEPFPEHRRIEVAPEELDPLAGRYRFGSGVVREVVVEEGRIFTRRDGGRKVEMFPTASGALVFDGTLSYVTFDRAGGGAAPRMLMHRDSGEVETGSRSVPDEQPEAHGR